MAGLLDFLYGGNDAQYPGVSGMQNSLVGMGMGLLTGGGPIGWQNALKGYDSGAKVDAANRYRREELAQHRLDQQRLADQFKQEMALRQRQFEMSSQTPEERQANALGYKPGSSERQTFLEGKYGPEGDWKIANDEASGLPYAISSRTLQTRPITLPGQTPSGAAVAAQPPTTSGVQWGTAGVGPQGFGTGSVDLTIPQFAEPQPAAPALPPRQYGQTPYFMGPNGPVQAPAGASPKGAAAFQQHVMGAMGDAAAGKYTEEQARSSLYARQMENAEKILSGQGGVESEGTSAYGKGTEAVPFGAGRYMQGNDYQRYSTARDQFINGALRRESGAAIKDSEYMRKEKQLFPQPGDTPQVIEDKRRARALAIEEMRRGAGPGYRPMSGEAVGAQPSAKPDPFGLR